MSFPKILYLPRKYEIELRNSKKLTVQKLAVIADVSESSLRYFESGRNLQAANLFYVLEKLAKVYDIDIEDFIKKEPAAKKYIKLFLGAEEFINNKKRYCLWLKNAEPGDLRKMKLVAERVENVRKVRSESKRDATKKLADTPYLFGEIRQPEEGTYLLVPRVSSEKRRYVPVGFLPCDVIASDATQIIPNMEKIYELRVHNVGSIWRVGQYDIDRTIRYERQIPRVTTP